MESTWLQLARLQTEQQAQEYENLDVSTSLEIVTMMNRAERATLDAVEKALPLVAEAVELVVERLQRGGRLFYVGAGTSGRLGILDAAECPPTFNTAPTTVQALIAGGRNAVFEAVENAEDQYDSGAAELRDRGLTKDDVVVGIAASGRTPYVLGALEYARQLGAATVAISCNPGSLVGRVADVAIEVETGPEVLMGSTRLKAGTAQKMILNMISTASMVRLGKVYKNLMVDLRATNEKLVERSKRIIMLATGVSYEEASQALVAADGHVKTAILMVLKRIDKEQAMSLLQQADGFLRRALELDSPF